MTEKQLSVFHFQHGDKIFVCRQQGLELLQADSAGFMIGGQKVGKGLIGGLEAVKLGVHACECHFCGMCFLYDVCKEFSQVTVRL